MIENQQKSDKRLSDLDKHLNKFMPQLNAVLTEHENTKKQLSILETKFSDLESGMDTKIQHCLQTNLKESITELVQDEVSNSLREAKLIEERCCNIMVCNCAEAQASSRESVSSRTLKPSPRSVQR